MTKIAYNNCFGGFSISDAGVRRYAEIKGITLYPEQPDGAYASLMSAVYWTVPPEEREGKYLADDAFNAAPLEAKTASNAFYFKHTINVRDFYRADPVLIQVIEELGDKANGDCAKLAIAEVPAGTKYRIDEYDGNESVMTVEDYEWQTA